MVTIKVEGEYDVPAETLWRHVVRYDALEAVMNGPFVRVRCPAGEECAGDQVELVFKLFGAVPVGRWRFDVTRRNDALRRLQSSERGTGVKSWTHEIAIDAIGDGRSRLVDTIEIDAGRLTPIVAWFARGDYARRHRVRRAMLMRTPMP